MAGRLANMILVATVVAPLLPTLYTPQLNAVAVATVPDKSNETVHELLGYVLVTVYWASDVDAVNCKAWDL